MPRVLLFASTTGYQVRSFADAAHRAGMELILATDRCHVLDDPWGDHAIALRTEDPADRGPFDGVLAVGDQPALDAAIAAERLGLRFSPAEAVLAAKNKHLSRQKFASAGLLVPDFRLNSRPDRYPCVLKPLSHSGSRGVIRADNPAEFAAAFARISRLLAHENDQAIQVEDFIPGREFALEGVATRGKLQVFALFDKPEPLDGPFFEETIYVTPSRESAAAHAAIVETTQRAIDALGLTDGPIHAEMRVNERGVWILEVAARPIGGLCSRVLRFSTSQSAPQSRPSPADQAAQSVDTLEDLLLRHAIGGDISDARLASGAHAVMMIPIPRAGVYRGVEGVDEARRVDGIEDVIVTAKPGQLMLPLPEGASYLGFIFARAQTSGEAAATLAESHALLRFEFAESLPLVK